MLKLILWDYDEITLNFCIIKILNPPKRSKEYYIIINAKTYPRDVMINFIEFINL